MDMQKRSSNEVNRIANRIAHDTEGLTLEGKNPAAAALGRRGILVLHPRRGALADCVLWVATTSYRLRFWSRADARALGLVNGWTGEQVSG